MVADDTTGAPSGELFVQDNGLAIATCGPVFVNLFYAPPTVQRLDELVKYQRALVERVPRHAVLSLVDPGVGREMGDDARRYARGLNDEMAPYTMGHCFVVLGSGFFAAMARSVIAGIQLLSRTKAPWRVTSDPVAGVAFIVELVNNHGAGALVDEEALQDVVDRMLKPVTRAAS